ncbi:MAG: class I SAM-dependent methyltransferase family protein [Deltaproteobacteria bacterium]|nr:class I SAM-dependent methyltransferase family protein [Deltaproteobacteria bacterium]
MSGKRSGNKTKKLNSLTHHLAARLGRTVIRHLSDLARESLKQPGNWRCLEIVYQNKPRTLLDRFSLSSRSARGARSRLRILQEEICKCIEQFSRINNPIRLISFGSGPGHEVLGCIERLRDSMVVNASCVDRDSSALECGRSLAIQKQLSDRIQYVQGNILRMSSGIAEYDIGILSGLIDYFDFETAVSVLKTVREQLLPGGTIFVANMRRHYLASTMSILGNWDLVYREPEELEKILRESKYERIKVWLEPEEVFCIGKARRPS